MTWDIRRTAVFAVFAYSFGLVAACDDDENHDDDYYNARIAPGGGGVSTRPSGGSAGRSGSGSSQRPDTGEAGSAPDDDDDDTDDDDSERDDAALLVEVEQGTLRGRWASDEVRAFLGIPYAEPPLAELRWTAPTQPTPWKKGSVRDATKYSARCAQLAPSLFHATEDTSEDCLYLNVWAPSVSSRVTLPVVVWIHGGDHLSGSASDQVPSGDGKYYDGSTLASHGVVVVSFNYRLGALGFLAHPELDAERSPFGNQGLRDQVAALTWVHDNIDQFGGDRANVTLVGQGSGAADVCMHVVSPLSQGLFQQAVGQSGGCTVYQPEPADLTRNTQAWVAAVGCDDAKDQLECLRTTSLDKLLKAAGDKRAFVPVVDGEFLPEQPRQLYRLNRFEPVPYVIGWSSDDGALFNADFKSVDSQDDYHAVLQKQFPDLSLETLCEIYPHDEFGDTPEGYRKVLAHLYGDAFVRCVVEDTAERASDGAADVYLYQFAVPADGNGIGPSHAAEVGYLFGTEPKLSAKQRTVGKLMQSYWVDFARNGYPDRNEDLPAWPPLSSKDESRMQFAFESKLVGDTNKQACEYWRSVYNARFPAQP